MRPKKIRKKGPHLILVGKLGKFSQFRKVHLEDLIRLKKRFPKAKKTFCDYGAQIKVEENKPSLKLDFTYEYNHLKKILSKICAHQLSCRTLTTIKISLFIWALPVWGGGLNPCPDGLWHLFLGEMSMYKRAFA